MNLRIRWKLMLSYLLLTLLMAGAFHVYMVHTIKQHLETEIRDSLHIQARLAGIAVAREATSLDRDGPRAATTIGTAVKARVTIIKMDGTVTGDSDIARSELGLLENHRSRPEVQQAIQSGSGNSTRYSATLHTSMLYAASSFTSANGEKGVIRLALPLSSLELAQKSMSRALMAAITLAVILSLGLSLILSRVASKSLKEMVSTAVQMGNGDFSRRVPVRSGDELGELAIVMNLMSSRIADQMQRLSSEKSRLDAILAGMGEGLLVTDARGIITLANPEFHRLLDIKEQSHGKALIEISRHPGLHDTFRQIVATTQPTLQEIGLPGARTILVHCMPLLHEEALEGVVAVFHDISEIRKLEKMRKEFVANVSHELRTPVTVIKGYAETLLSGEVEASSEQTHHFILVIHRHAERLASLINDLLILSELESGSLAIRMTPTAVSDVAAIAMSLLAPKAEEKHIQLINQLNEADAVMADRRRVEQVLFNLLDNAIKYTPEGGSVKVSAETIQDMVEVSVHDSGTGIREKDIPRLFERFYRADESRSRDQGGTGLGLSIVKHIIQLHDGKVMVKSTPGKGSTFTFSLKKAHS